MVEAMAEETHTHATEGGKNKRRIGHKKGSKANKKQKVFQGTDKKVKIDKRMKKIFLKRARDYNSDDDEESAVLKGDENEHMFHETDVVDGKYSDEEVEDHGEEIEISEDEDGGIQPGITKLIDGCKAFRMAFKKISKTSISDDLLGPVLSVHKKLIAEKLGEEEEERKVKREAKKEKNLVEEKGHVKPANILDSHEKFLIGVATKGVVKLFNAVNKAQSAQKGLNPSRFKDAKALGKRRKEAFFSELGKTSSRSAEASAKVHSSTGPMDGEGPGWAPLRDNYMLTSSKLKDWDKMPDTTMADDIGKTPLDSSSDDD